MISRVKDPETLVSKKKKGVFLLVYYWLSSYYWILVLISRGYFDVAFYL